MEVVKQGKRVMDKLYKIKCSYCGAKIKASTSESSAMHYDGPEKVWVYHYTCPCCGYSFQVKESEMKEVT